MSHEKWKNVSETVRNVVATIGLLAAGFWTFVTFEALKTKSRAEREITKLEVEEQELRERLRKSSSVTASLSAKVLGRTTGGATYVEITTKLKNAGTEKAVIKLSGPPVTIIRLEMDSQGIPREIERHSGHVLVVGADTQSATGLLILPGESKVCHTIVRVRKPGLYLATFFATRPLHEQKEAMRQGMPSTESAAIFASEYVTVGKWLAATLTTRYRSAELGVQEVHSSAEGG